MLVLCVATFTIANAQDPGAAEVPEVTMDDDGKQVTIRIGNQTIASYLYRHREIRRPFFANVLAPGGRQVTRNFPPRAGDRKDHADMHPGIWMAFGDISGEDFWRNKGRIVHDGFSQTPTEQQGPATFVEQKKYVSSDGRLLCNERFRCTLHPVPQGYLFEFDTTLSAPKGEHLTLGDQEEMGLGVRVATPIAELSGGRMTDSDGRQGAEDIWSQPSNWCDYSGSMEGHPVGVTIFCHPDNIRESWMHARDYGLLVANPFGRNAMKKGPPSRIVVKPDQPLRLRYGVLLHDATPNLEETYRDYIAITRDALTRETN